MGLRTIADRHRINARPGDAAVTKATSPAAYTNLPGKSVSYIFQVQEILSKSFSLMRSGDLMIAGIGRMFQAGASAAEIAVAIQERLTFGCTRARAASLSGYPEFTRAGRVNLALGDTEEHFTAGLAIMIALSKEKAMRKRSSVAVILICGFTALSLAQAPPERPKPGPEHKKLEYFLGTWKTEGEIKANEYVPAGKSVTTETYTLGAGGFYIEVDRPEGQIPRTQGITAYDSHAKVYTTFYVSSAGLVGGGTGTVDGNTWTWMLEDKWLGQAVKGRTTVTVKSASQFTVKYEMLDPNGRYVTITEGTSTKVAP